MKKNYFYVSLLALALAMPSSGFASIHGVNDDGLVVTMGLQQNQKSPMRAAQQSEMVINGTGGSQTFILNAQGLVDDVKLSATSGFEVFPEVLPAGTTSQEITVILKSTLSVMQGQIKMRSGDIYAFVDVTGYGTPLPTKDLSQSPVYTGTGDDEGFVKTRDDGFTPGDNGYTIEFKVKTDKASKSFDAYAITGKGYGVKTYVASDGFGIYSSDRKLSLKNLSTFQPAVGDSAEVENGSGKFYNTDGKYHTYRFAVTPDQRVFIYRDGIAVDTLRSQDWANQPDWGIENGEYKENLLKNGDFEGEWNYERGSSDYLTRVEGYDIARDLWNGDPKIKTLEIDNEHDFTNHIFALDLYRWDGWGGTSAYQIVDVAPNETYSFSCIARGGYYNKKDVITYCGKIRISENQNKDLKVETTVVSGTEFAPVGLEYTTSGECKQLRVEYIMSYVDSRATEPMEIDDAKLEGVSRILDQKIGFDNSFADVEYFTYDTTGAYAPVMAQMGGRTGIQDMTTGVVSVYGQVSNNMLFLQNVPESATVKVYNSMGVLVSLIEGYTSEHAIPLNTKGIFICVIDDGVKKQNIKVIN